MSKTIKQSVDSLSSSATSLESSLSKCKTSISNKGVSVPSSTTFSGLPALIDKIQTKEKYSLKIYKPVTTSLSKTYYIRVKSQYGGYSKTFTPTKSETVLEDLEPGLYSIDITTDRLRFYKVNEVTVGPQATANFDELTVFIVFDDVSDVQSVRMCSTTAAFEELDDSYTGSKNVVLYHLSDYEWLSSPTLQYKTKSGTTVWTKRIGSGNFDTSYFNGEPHIIYLVTVNTSTKEFKVNQITLGLNIA